MSEQKACSKCDSQFKLTDLHVVADEKYYTKSGRNMYNLVCENCHSNKNKKIKKKIIKKPLYKCTLEEIHSFCISRNDCEECKLLMYDRRCMFTKGFEITDWMMDDELCKFFNDTLIEVEEKQ